MNPGYCQFQKKLSQILIDIVKHGFGEAQIRISMEKGNKRQIVVVAGRSYLFTIDISDIDL